MKIYNFEFDLAEGQPTPDASSYEGTFHTHPKLVSKTGSDDMNTMGTRSSTKFTQEPSSSDLSNAKARADRGVVTGNSVVLAQGNNTAYIYNKSGVVATFPLTMFTSIGIEK